MKDNLHVLIIPSWYPESKEDFLGSFFREQAIGLYKQEVQVGVIYPDLRFPGQLKKIRVIPRIHYENDDGINTYRMLWNNWFPKLRSLQIRSFKLLGIDLFKKYLERFGKPDLIHCHSVVHGGFLSEYILEKYNIPFVITEHSSGYHTGRLRKYYKDISRISNKASFCFGVSAAFCQLLKKEIPNSPDWKVHFNMVSNDFLKEDLSPKSKEPFTFISIGNLIKGKNTSLILKSFQQFNKIHANSNLKIIGAGVEMKNLLNESKELGIGNHVAFLGRKNRTEVIQALKTAHAFVSGSIYETFGVVFVESLAMGVPIISTSCGGSDDIINRDVGILTMQNDVEDMYKSMLYLYHNYDKYEQNKIREYCNSNFSESNLSLKMITHYNSIIGRS